MVEIEAMIYTVKKIYLYSETVEVEAESEIEAEDKAAHMEGDRNFDDRLYDCRVVGRKEKEEHDEDP